MGSGETERRRRRPGHAAAAALLLVAMSSVVYLPAIDGKPIWDDNVYVTENVMLRSADGLKRIWFEPRASPQYYPVVFSSFWLDYQLWGTAPRGYHASNVALHAVNALLVWLVLRRLSVPGAYFAAACFALHPVNVESVAWISERKNVLSGLFYLLALLAWFGFTAQRSARRYGLALLLFAGALLSKSAACTLPVIILLLAWWKSPRRWYRDIPLMVPFFLLGGALAAVTVWRENLGGVTAGIEAGLSGLGKLMLAGRVLWFYAGKLVWPLNLMTIYPHWTIDPNAAVSSAWPLLAVIVFLGFWLWRERLGRGPLVATLCFTINLAPVLGLVPFDFMRFSYVADHFQYLPSVALIALVAAAHARVVARAPSAWQYALKALSVLVLIVLGVLSWRQASPYADAEVLWRDNIAKNPRAFAAHTNLGMVLLSRGRIDEAIIHQRIAVKLQPRAARAHASLAAGLAEKGLTEEAIREYEEALRLHPSGYTMHRGFGVLLDQEGRLAEAAFHLSRALDLRPDDARSHNSLAIVLIHEGRLGAAEAHLRTALRFRPDFPAADNNLATVLIRRGDFAAAAVHAANALRLDPRYAQAHNTLGVALASQGRPDEALAQFREALRLDPANRGARANLARARKQLQPAPPATTP